MPASPNAAATRLSEGAGDVAEIVRALDAEGVAIADLRVHAPTLDDVFLAKTGRSLEGAGAGAGEGEGEGGARSGDDGARRGRGRGRAGASA